MSQSGISWMSRIEEENARLIHQSKKTQVNENKEGGNGAIEKDAAVAMRASDKAFVQEQSEKVLKWLESNPSVSAGDVVELSPCNSFQRLLLYQHLRSRFGERILVEKKEGSGGEGKLRSLVISLRPSEDVLEAKQAEEEALWAQSLHHQVGFRHVFEALVQAKKPLIGHNCWLDLCHWWSKFVGPMPSDWDAWKASLHRDLFPCILDTKHLAKTALGTVLLENSLSDLVAWVSETHRHLASSILGTETSPRNGNKTREIQFHDAGYDALCTGLVFLGILQDDQATRHLSNQREGQGLDSLLERVNQAVKGPLANRLNVMQSDYPFIRLDPVQDVMPDRSRVFYCGTCPPFSNNQEGDNAFARFEAELRLTTSSIQEAYDKLLLKDGDTGDKEDILQVLWSGPDAFFLILPDERNGEVLMTDGAFVKALGINRPHFTMVPFAKYHAEWLPLMKKHGTGHGSDGTSQYTNRPPSKRPLATY